MQLKGRQPSGRYGANQKGVGCKSPGSPKMDDRYNCTRQNPSRDRFETEGVDGLTGWVLDFLRHWKSLLWVLALCMYVLPTHPIVPGFDPIACDSTDVPHI